MWVRWGYALPLLALAASMNPVPSVDPGFWKVLAAGVPLEIAAGLLYLHALKVSPMSLALPFLAWTPVFTALASFIILGELPGPSGAAGIGLVTAGSFLLTWEAEDGASGLYRCLRREKGVLCMLAAALVYSLTSALGKLGVGYSSPSFFGFTYALFVTAAYTALLVWRERSGLLSALRPNRSFLAVGVATGLMTVFHFAAIDLTQVAYMISVKRSSLLFSVLLGRLFFGERQTGRRFFGTAVMCAGMLMIVAED
jgi:drug/metabolite transporter (DMT)-like permease